MIRYSIIATGSKGNAVKIDDILIDCGVSFKKLKDVYKYIRLVLLTHEHSDHIKGAGIMSRKLDIPIYANFKTWCGMKDKIGNIKE